MTRKWLVKVIEETIYYKIVSAYDEDSAQRQADAVVNSSTISDDWARDDSHIYIPIGGVKEV
jgi:hypothetical protein